MRSYFNGSGLSCTPPPGSGLGPGRPPHRPGLMSGRASSSSLPRSPDQDTASMCLTSGLGTGSGSGQSGHGSLGSHSSHEVSYMNIYQNTNHPHLYVSFSLSLLLESDIMLHEAQYTIFICRTPTWMDRPATPWVQTTVPT